MEHDGQVYVVWPHSEEATAALRHCGWDVPAPILFDHEVWNGPFAPFEHQRATAAFMTMNPRGFVLNDMGTGKTAATVWAVRWLKRTGRIRSVLVVAPLSTVMDVWEREFRRLAPELRAVVLTGSKEKRLRLHSEGADVYIINHDGVKVMAEQLANDASIDAIVIDESTAFKNARTERWKAMNLIVNRSCRRTYVWGMTGTPTLQAPTDAWAQSRLVLPGVAPRRFKTFQDMTMLQVGPYEWRPRPEANAIVLDVLTPYVRVRKEDCFDMPPITYVTRHCELTDLQKKLEAQILKRWVAVFKSGETITPANAAARISKLLQIYQGVVIGDVRRYVVDARPRYELMLELVNGSQHGVIVFVPFKAVLHRVRKFLEDNGVTATHVYGGTSQRIRAERFDAFRSGRVKVLVAHPATTSHGLSFTNADTIIWFGPYMSAEGYEQANQRMARPGQDKPMTIYHLSAGRLEDRMYGKLQQKLELHGELLKLMEEMVK